MSDSTKKGFSVGILSTIATSLILTIIYALGNYTVKAHDTAIDVDYVKKQMDGIDASVKTINQTMNEIALMSYENSKEVEKNTLRLLYCERWQSKCETFHKGP